MRHAFLNLAMKGGMKMARICVKDGSNMLKELF
jgi:hypothetical protein